MREYELVELDLSSRDAHITTTDWYSVSLTIFFSKSGQKIVKITQNKDTVWKSNMDDEHAHSLFLFKGKRSTMTLELEETATSEDSLEKTGVPRRMGGKNSEDKEGGISECQLLEIVVTKSPTNVRGEPTAPVGERIPSKFHRVYFYNEGGEWTPTDAATFHLKLDGMKMNGKITASDSTIAPNIAHFVKPESPPVLFGIDIDGTFFVENEAVFRKNIEAFAKVMKMGYTPFLCTGRTLNGSVSKLGASLFDRTDYKGYPGVYGNGTLVFDKEGNVIHQTYFSPSFISKIIQHINNTGYRQKVVFQDIERYYSLEFAPFIVSRLLLFYEKMNPLIVDEETLLKLKICSISILDCTFDIEDLKIEYSKKEVQLGMFCELVPRNATKATGIKKLMEHYGVPLEECGFIGDGDNDTEAMNFCKVSFAVGNSPDFVKRHAKWVMEKTCDEGAVAQALELVYK